MHRRGASSLHGPPQSEPPSLSTYIEAAPVDHISASLKGSKRRRKKRQKPQQEPLNASVLAPSALSAAASTPSPAPAKPARRKRKTKVKNSILRSRDVQKCREFIVRNLVTAEELEDEDETTEIQEEVTEDFKRFGEIKDLLIIKEKEGDTRVGDVVITFKEIREAERAFNAYDGKVFGGKTVECRWQTQTGKMVARKVVVVCGVVTAEEVEDPDEAEDVKDEVLQAMGKYGGVEDLQVDEKTGDATVTFHPDVNVKQVAEKINRSHYGGHLVTARIIESGVGNTDDVEDIKFVLEVETKRTSPLGIQPIDSLEIQEIVCTFLKRLAGLQERAHVQNPQHDKRSRRLVLGMHEVRRGLFRSKISLLVIATDLKASGLLDDHITELVEIATEQEVPVISPLNRRRLGRALNKSVRILAMVQAYTRRETA